MALQELKRERADDRVSPAQLLVADRVADDVGSF
jgi:hypothetical protein